MFPHKKKTHLVLDDVVFFHVVTCVHIKSVDEKIGKKKLKTVGIDASESASNAVDPQSPTGGGCLDNLWVPWVWPDPFVYPTLVVFLEPDLPWATALGRSYRVTITPR